MFIIFITKLSSELLKKWTLSMNNDGSLGLIPFFFGYWIVKFIYSYIVFGMTIILLYFTISWKIRC